MSTEKLNIEPDNNLLVKVENLSKKFCKDLKTSLWYGVQDLFGGLANKHHLTLRTKEFWAVKDVSFELRRGECLGLIGHNGAGKSTLLKILNGLINPDAGKVTMKGRVGALIELGAGFNPILSGRENIYNNGAVLGFTKKEIDSKLEAIIAFAELEDFIDMPVQHYSSGMKVRLGFAVAAQMEPDVLIIDEVLAVGDLGFILKCFKTIDTILPHTAVIFVSHNMPMVSRICNKIILMEHGKALFQGVDVAQAIDLYYSRFNNNEMNVVYSDASINLVKAEITSSRSQVNRIDQLHWKDNLTIKLEFENKLLTRIPIFILTIFDKEQRPVAQLEENKKQIKNFSNEKIVFEVNHPSLMLSKGLYSINVAVKNKESKEPILRMNNILNFQILHQEEIWPPFLLESKYTEFL